MESAAVLRSFHCISSPLKSIIDKPGVVSINNAGFSSCPKHLVQGLSYGGKLMSTPNKLGGLAVSCAKASEAPVIAKSDDLGNTNGAVMSDSFQNGSGPKNPIRQAIFPNGFEALVTEVCDDTEIAELKVKVGDFEMHLKRDIEPPKPPTPVESPNVASAIPSKPMNESESAPAPAPALPKPSAEKISPFTNVPAEKSAKLSALEASGTSGYVVVSSPTVGSFQRGRTLKGKKQPPVLKEGDVIKEGQTIGFLNQFGTELPIKSDAAGEVLKILYNEGEAVGYGDPLIAVLPSFHGVK